jgi:UTP--glucose-1-phosphate uridylyltransferase
MSPTFDAFKAFQERMQRDGLPDLAIETFRRYFEALRSGKSGLLSRDQIRPLDHVPNAEDFGAHRPAGEAALDRCVVIKLNGGLGTSMGMTRAKSLLPVKDGHSFLDLIALQVLHLRRVHDARLPLVLMNSFRTREDSLAALERHPKLPSELPPDFLQHKVPKIRADDLTPAVWPRDPEHEWCPPGHGDLYTALLTSGMLETLLGAGYRFAFVSNSDNLGAVPDPTLLGFMAERNVPFLMEVCPRTAAHKKGGHLARRTDGALVLRELAQCPDDELDEFQDIAVHRFFNTNNLWIDLEALDAALRSRQGVLELPMIRNEKTLDPTDADSPRVFQLETAMGSAIEVFDGAEAVCVPGERFAPVKTTADLLALWSDAYRVAEDFRIVTARGEDAETLVVDLDPAFYKHIGQLEARFPYGAPSLVGCRRFSVHGDVLFGRDIVAEGDVEVSAPGDDQRIVPDGRKLGGDGS